MFDFVNVIETSSAIIALLFIGLIIFAESGLLVGFFLPGDTLLFPAGFFAAQGKLPLGLLILTVIICAIIGYDTGYRIGKRIGPRLFTKEDGIIFRQEYVMQAEEFYEKHGGKTMLMARFVPIVRTLAPVVAGVGSMDKKTFWFYNVMGAAVWGTGVILLGYWLGSKIPNIDRYILPVILAATLITLTPTVLHIMRDPKIRARLWRKISRKK